MSSLTEVKLKKKKRSKSKREQIPKWFFWLASCLVTRLQKIANIPLRPRDAGLLRPTFPGGPALLLGKYNQAKCHVLNWNYENTVPERSRPQRSHPLDDASRGKVLRRESHRGGRRSEVARRQGKKASTWGNSLADFFDRGHKCAYW